MYFNGVLKATCFDPSSSHHQANLICISISNGIGITNTYAN
jgi:hypothetical protein